MAGVADLLKDACRVSAGATGKLALAIETRKFSPKLARQIVMELRMVADALEEAAVELDKIKRD